MLFARMIRGPGFTGKGTEEQGAGNWEEGGAAENNKGVPGGDAFKRNNA